MAAALKLVEEYSSLELRQLDNKMFRGPFVHPLWGSYIEMNLVNEATKVCNYDCVSCNLGATTIKINKIRKSVQFHAAASLVQGFEAELQRIKSLSLNVGAIVIAGNGDPLLHPQYDELTNPLMSIKNQHLDKLKLVVLTNATYLDSRKILSATQVLDDTIIRLDAGSEKLFKKIHSPITRTNLAQIIENASRLSKKSVLATFQAGRFDNTNPTDIEEWIEVVAVLHPQNLVLRTIAHVPATSGLIPMDEQWLYELAARVERKMNIKPLVWLQK